MLRSGRRVADVAVGLVTGAAARGGRALALQALTFEDQSVGSGRQVQVGDLVEVHYTTMTESGRMLECTYQAQQAVQFEAGGGMVMPGLDMAVLGMRAGGRRIARVPPALAYGRFSQPPTASLIIEVDLVSTDPAAADDATSSPPDSTAGIFARALSWFRR